MRLTQGDMWGGEGPVIDESACPHCLSEMCDGSCTAPSAGLDHAALTDAVAVAREGQAIARDGIRYLVDGIIPSYGMAGFMVAFAKVGKSTLGHRLGAAVAMGTSFLDRATRQCRVLTICAEDPPEYVAYLARHLDVAPGAMTFYRAPLVLNTAGLAQICATVRTGTYGLVLISSWQACIRTLIRDENDNAGAVAVAENVKTAARETGVPWLIDAHAGKGEDASDDADPVRALRGASSAGGAMDYLLSLRYAGSPFTTQRRFSGKGRFVSLPPLTLDFDPATSTYCVVGNTKDAHRDSTWQLIVETGAIDETPRSLTEIGRACGLVHDGEKLDGAKRRQLVAALGNRPSVGRADGVRRGQKTLLYRRLSDAP